jgi:hypothetical protein
LRVWGTWRRPDGFHSVLVDIDATAKSDQPTFAAYNQNLLMMRACEQCVVIENRNSVRKRIDPRNCVVIHLAHLIPQHSPDLNAL